MVLDLAISAAPDALREIEDGTMLSLVASAETHGRWADERGRHHPWGSRAKRGLADGTLRTLDVCRGLTLVCQREGCGSLVHWMAARRRARAANRDNFEPGDGCSSRSCSGNHRPAQHHTGQRSMAAGLEKPLADKGGRLLITWPVDTQAREVQVLPRARAVAQAATTRLDAAAAAAAAPPTTRGSKRRRCD